jgi:nucleoside 2-deoxyribosyltransferase-like protein
MAVRYVEAPHDYVPDDAAPPSVFLAGGITGTVDWQDDVVRALADRDCVVFNPRRFQYLLNDPDAEREQVGWECRYRKAADIMLFWFPASVTMQPIALLELGAALAQRRGPDRLVVGADVGYPRQRDVVLQCEFDGPIRVHDTLADVVAAVRELLPAA